MLAGALVGFGFLTKMLQALLVVPAFALVYLVAAPTTVRPADRPRCSPPGWPLLVSAGWWVAIVELVPASARPYIGGSQHNSILELILGYNGLGRLTGNETGSVGGGGGGGTGMWGQTGWSRLFNSEIGGQVAWLLPAALILLVAGLVVTGRRRRTDRTRAALLLWGGWLLVTGLTFSFMAGIFHAYYTVALAPAIGALVGIGAALLWRRRDGAAGAGDHARGDRGLVVRAARAQRRLPALAGAGGARRSGSRSRSGSLLVRWLPRRVGGRAGRSRADGRAGRAGGVRGGHGGDRAHRLDPVGAGRRWPGRCGGPGGGGFRGGPGVPQGGFGGGPGGGIGAVPGGGATRRRRCGGAGRRCRPAARAAAAAAAACSTARTPSADMVALLQADADGYTWVAAAIGVQQRVGLPAGHRASR